MSSFFNRQSEMFDAKKKRLVGGTSSSATGSGNEAEDRFVVASASDDAHEGPDSMPESWVELAASRTSLCSSVEAVNMDEANSGSSFNRDSRLSPVSLHSPCVELESSLEQVKYRLAKDVLVKNNDWIWDWSSRPEALPHSGNCANGSQQQMNQTLQLQQIASALTTPPNSPEPDLLMSGRSGIGGFDFSPLRQTKKPSLFSSFLRFEVIVGLVVSNIMTFVLGATIGFCICKKVRKGDTDSLLKMSAYNYNRW